MLEEAHCLPHPPTPVGRGLARAKEEVMWLVMTLLSFLFVFLGAGAFSLSMIKRAKHHHPIVCVCKVNNRIGVVLRRDHNRASERHWGRRMPYYFSNKKRGTSFPWILDVSPVFVFEDESREYKTLITDCRTEVAVFSVPPVGDNTTMLVQAHQHFFNKPWDGKLIS